MSRSSYNSYIEIIDSCFKAANKELLEFLDQLLLFYKMHDSVSDTLLTAEDTVRVNEEFISVINMYHQSLNSFYRAQHYRKKAYFYLWKLLSLKCMCLELKPTILPSMIEDMIDEVKQNTEELAEETLKLKTSYPLLERSIKHLMKTNSPPKENFKRFRNIIKNIRLKLKSRVMKGFSFLMRNKAKGKVV